MRALVPVSVRTKDQQNTLGNQITVMRGPLPVYIGDPVARLDFVRKAMDGLKESKQAEGAATLAAVNNLAPPTVLAQASRLNFSTRLFNLIVTNIPGPQMPLYVLGRELKDLFPVAFLPENHALAVAIMSYNGNLDFGLLGDFDALPDIDLIAEGLDAVVTQLLEIARQGSGASIRAARGHNRTARSMPPRQARRRPTVSRPGFCPRATGGLSAARPRICAPSANAARARLHGAAAPTERAGRQSDLRPDLCPSGVTGLEVAGGRAEQPAGVRSEQIGSHHDDHRNDGDQDSVFSHCLTTLGAQAHGRPLGHGEESGKVHKFPVGRRCANLENLSADAPISARSVRCVQL